MPNQKDYSGEYMRRGRVEVICGSMFSGKTEELIRRMKRAKLSRQKVEIFKPSIDVRYSDEDVVSHEGKAIPSTPVESAASILLMGSDADVLGIDEAQFFDDQIIDVCNELANRGTRVIVAGLDLPSSVPSPTMSRRSMPSVCAAARWHTSATASSRVTDRSCWARPTNTNPSAVNAMRN